jgi:predicted nucleic acid-binding protein
MFLLDTNVISELRRPDKADRNVAAWANAVPAASFFMSAISILEIELGALLVARKDAAQGAVLRAWIDHQILARFEGRVLAVDTAVAQRCARLHVPDPRAERDALIAATALVHGLTVVTRNVTDFEPTGVALINPWEHRRAGDEGSQ